jgi:hypothetical protein
MQLSNSASELGIDFAQKYFVLDLNTELKNAVLCYKFYVNDMF